MRPACGIDALPPHLRQQLLAMPLSDTELTEIVDALMRMHVPAVSAPHFLFSNKNAPRPDRQRGV